MFIVTLRFADKAKAPAHMEGHNAWLRRRFDDGIFLLSGSLQPSAGGVVLAHGLSRTELEHHVADDPFVVEGVVTAEITEVTPGRTDTRLAFLTKA
ncbi:hypothetical protein MMA231_00017 [Asticcacaulis sp. MM231]|jgi:uncharacterized protein YciI|uniref:YciI family protein n=1 Tax=Asticcacaulis sp. MM231 TaxID=3157666 RepID=UPI0032D59CC2